MALEEFFVPNMPQFYGTTAQLLRNRVDFEDDLRVDMLATPQPSRQFQVHLRLSTWLHRTVGKAVATRLMEVVTAWLRRAHGLRFRGMRGTEISPKHTPLDRGFS